MAATTTPTPFTRPYALPVLPERIPDELKLLDHWIDWRYSPETNPATGETDWDKPPRTIHGGLASTTDPDTQSSFDAALAAYQSGPVGTANGYDGIGFVVRDDDGLTTVDLDNCRDPETGTLESWAARVVFQLDTYAEVSPSGKGVRLFLRGKLPPGRRKGKQFECYDRARYVTVTGQILPGSPRTINERAAQIAAVHAEFFPPTTPPPPQGSTPQTPQNLADTEILRLAAEADDGEKFRRLWSGDASAYGSHSEADLALCNILAFWAGPDPERIESLFNMSGLVRSKWQREDYRVRTIQMALEGRTEFYGGPAGTPTGRINRGATNGQANGHANGQAAYTPGKVTIYSAPQILRMDLPPAIWIVPGMVSEGLTILAGKPKLGKSMIAMNLALNVADGGLALGAFRAVAGDVLYLCLEDRLQRVQHRLQTMATGLRVNGTSVNEQLKIAITWPRQAEGGLEEIEHWVRSVPRPRLVIVDIWQRIRPSLRNGSHYEQDYAHLMKLQELANKYGICILIVHHCKKGKSEDIIEEVTGTMGLTGVADGILVFCRNRHEPDGVMDIIVRDGEDRKIALKFDANVFLWAFAGEAEEFVRKVMRDKLVGLFMANAGVVMGPGEIADRLDLVGDQRDRIKGDLLRLEREGQIEKAGNGRWKWPIQTPTLAATDDDD